LSLPQFDCPVAVYLTNTNPWPDTTGTVNT
jgi:hypothetical protein